MRTTNNVLPIVIIGCEFPVFHAGRVVTVDIIEKLTLVV